MKLLKVSIQNYRSIEKLSLAFPLGCQALIGMNESGKSNILRALSLIDPATSVLPSDLRIERRGETEVREGLVEFQFQLDEDEMSEAVGSLLEKFGPRSSEQPLVSLDGRELTLHEFCALRNKGFYAVKLPDGKRSANYYKLPDEFQVLPGWAHNPTDSDLTVQGVNGELATVITAKGFARLDPSAVISPLEAATASQLNDLVGAHIREIIPKRLLKCIFWKYNDQYLLPSSIDVNSFAANPDACVPLRSMFELAGYKGQEIGVSINKARASAPHRYIQLLRNVQEAGTKHVREVWTDHKHVQIELQPNGDLLLPLISDETVPLDMANRSDGFKRFVSFLLLISAKVRSAEMKDVLLLIDEPEIALNPGGARSLMQELIEVGKTNTVVYSTHSIFMIDKRQVDRHIIIERKSEITTAKRAEKSKIQDDQVLYAALGYSLFEVLKEKNVIFEGWKDKEIFRVAAESVGKSDKEKKAVMSNIGLTYSEGVKDVKHVSSILELAGRSCLIISDADKVAEEKRKAYQKIGAWGKWVTLRDILGADSTVQTGEDLLTSSAVVKKANKWRVAVPTLSPLEEQQLTMKPCLAALSAWLNSSDLNEEAKDQALSELKTALFENLKRDELAEDAAKLVDYVLNYEFPCAGS